MTRFSITHKARSVNSKPLLKQFVQLFDDITDDYVMAYRDGWIGSPVVYDFSQVVAFVDAYLEDLAMAKTITTYDVVGDHRNNNINAMKNGRCVVVVEYQQFNCLNTTAIEFTIQLN